MKNNVILVGPFIGELQWEFFHFAPYVIHLKKKNPKIKIIVLTRIERFDLYGKYADVLIPLRLKNDTKKLQDCFKLNKYQIYEYEDLIKYFYLKINKKYKIIEHIFPKINYWMYKVKWQFSRSKMDYDFQPRKGNKEIADKLILDKVFLSENDINELIPIINKLVDYKYTSLSGVLIESIKNYDYFIGDINTSIYAHLALLLKIKLNYTKPTTEDYIKLINPLNTPTIGVKI